MKKTVVQTITQGEKTYGQVSNPQDLMKAQDYIYERIGNLAFDFLNNQKSSQVTGFAYELDGGNSFNITVKAPGRVYKTDGIVYDLMSDAELTIEVNDNAEPRIDLIVAVLEDDIPAELALMPFVRLRTSEDFTNGVQPYPPQNINAPQEKHWRAVIQIKTGTPGLIPTVPTVNSNEIPLYLISVAGGAEKIRDEDIADLREIILTLRKVNQLTGKNTIDIAKILSRLETLEVLANQPIDLSQVFGQIRTLGDILSSFERQMRALRDLPDVRYRNPKMPLTDKDSAKIPATGALQDGNPVVDIEIGGSINFGDNIVILRPENFPPSVNARFFQKVTTPKNTTIQTNLSLGGVTQIAADGFTDFVEKSANFDASRARPASAARDGQFIEIFGGLAADNATALGDWLTYDVENDTLTPQVPSTALPVSNRPAMMSCGDGTNVLLIAGNDSNPNPRIFKLNAVSRAVTEITTTKPTGISFFGDLIAPGKIFVVALRKESSGVETDFWEFDTTTNQFTQIGTTGSVPSLELDYAHGCFYQENEFLLVSFSPGVTASGRTYIFNRTSAMWTEINIAQPYGGTAEKQYPLNRFRLANVNGRPLLIAGLLTKDTDSENAKIWEFTASTTLGNENRKSWKSYDATFPPVTDAGFCSTLVSGRAKGKAVFFAGQGKFSNSKKHVYASVQGGLIATTYKGSPAITIADSSTFAQFVVPTYNATWDVAGYLLSLVGDWNDSNLLVEVSFDNGVNFHPVAPEKLLLITDSDDPGRRHLRFTLYNLKSSKPTLAKLVEIFDQDGGVLENRIVIRYDAPNVTKALYVDRLGNITLSEVIEPSTPEKCLLHKVTLDGSEEPILKNYINMRRPHIKYEGSYGGAFDNELAVEARYVDARGIVASGGHLYKIVSPDIFFDETINVVVNSGDYWVVEIAGEFLVGFSFDYKNYNQQLLIFL